MDEDFMQTSAELTEQMMALTAAEVACYMYPESAEKREAFLEGMMYNAPWKDSEIARLRARVTALLSVIEPFAQIAESFPYIIPDDSIIELHHEKLTYAILLLSDFRRAQTALTAD